MQDELTFPLNLIYQASYGAKSVLVDLSEFLSMPSYQDMFLCVLVHACVSPLSVLLRSSIRAFCFAPCPNFTKVFAWFLFEMLGDFHIHPCLPQSRLPAYPKAIVSCCW